MRAWFGVACLVVSGCGPSFGVGLSSDAGRDDASTGLGSIQDAGPRDASAGDGSASDARALDSGSGLESGAADAAPRSCPDPNGMLRVPSAAGSFCIDRTEVTNSAYAAFLAARPTLAAQPAACSFNRSFEPTSWPEPSDRARYPVVNVDWCDAYAYCAWAGKRLCGAVQGGAASFASPTLDSAWYAACSRGGARVYPYGGTFDPAACRISGGSAVGAAGSLASCEGGYAGLFDMAGNVEEWEDACEQSSGAGDRCQRRGGSTFDGDAQSLTRCDTPYREGNRVGIPRSQSDPDVGFRCCAP